ncbi:hypothetical protein AG1IA_08153 [Rhizoctonia solani AG-1 IA]|uniref:Uncharacterized protein n=1 Tax=Thanatephorus cucumeris (strain AG1-IA) TaxID=983506 RepID=L8WLX8_THACA|nr:hypothetical protein AG1IA_08153 [Rhizoctonia solani AG-1 IA]
MWKRRGILFRVWSRLTKTDFRRSWMKSRRCAAAFMSCLFCNTSCARYGSAGAILSQRYHQSESSRHISNSININTTTIKLVARKKNAYTKTTRLGIKSTTIWNERDKQRKRVVYAWVGVHHASRGEEGREGAGLGNIQDSQGEFERERKKSSRLVEFVRQHHTKERKKGTREIIYKKALAPTRSSASSPQRSAQLTQWRVVLGRFASISGS